MSENNVKNTQTNDVNNEEIKTSFYQESYNISPQFLTDLEAAIGSFPFKNVRVIFEVLRAEPVMSKQRLEQVLDSIAQFPYNAVNPILTNLGKYIAQAEEDKTHAGDCNQE